VSAVLDSLKIEFSKITTLPAVLKHIHTYCNLAQGIEV